MNYSIDEIALMRSMVADIVTPVGQYADTPEAKTYAETCLQTYMMNGITIPELRELLRHRRQSKGYRPECL